MKKIYILLFIIYFGQKEISHAQTYVPFDTSNAMWYSGWGYNTVPYYYLGTFYHYINGDTIINNMLYHKVDSSDIIPDPGPFFWLPPLFLTYVPFPGGAHYVGALREDANKHIYFIPATYTSDTLLYDFNLNLGDTLTNTFLTYNLVITVDSIDSIFDGSIYRKRYQLKQWNISGYCSLIEGIGSSFGLINPIALPFGGEQWASLLCYSKDTVVKYIDLAYQLCSITGISEHHEKGNNLSLYPNPTSDFFTVDLKNNSKTTIEIYNSIGKKIFDGVIDDQSTKEINTQTFPAGLYFVKINSRDKNYSQKIIIIH